MPSGRLPKKYLLVASALVGLALAGVVALGLPGTSDSSAVVTLPLLKATQGTLGLQRQPHLRSLRIRVARSRRPVVAKPWQ
jgi:hypothetical protein